MTAGTVRVWLALDPETRRVLVQDREFADGDFPPGLRGVGWPRRTTEVAMGSLTRLLRADVTPEAMDTTHRRWWDQAAASGDPPWPHLPGGKSPVTAEELP